MIATDPLQNLPAPARPPAQPRTGRGRRWLWLLLLVSLAVMAGEPHAVGMPEALPALGGGGEGAATAPEGAFVLAIPRLGLSLEVVQARVRGDTWDFSAITGQAAHLELTAYPGQGSNVVIGAHYELADFSPGPFYRLDALQPGDLIEVFYQGHRYVYAVSATLLVDPLDIDIVYRTPEETLTLLTCYSYNRTTGSYARRYVVRAALAEGPSA